MLNLFATKPLSLLNAEANEEGEHTLKRSLSALNLITLGIGAIIGAGIFVLTGQAAATHAGPAVALSFILAGIVCAFAGLCYAEFASIIPIAGSAYTYGYATLGEFVAWIIGWDLVLEYAFGAATVASGWSGYFVSLLQQLHIHLPPQITTTYGNVLVLYNDKWTPLTSMPMNIDASTLPHATGVFNVIAFLSILIITAILVIGIKESANLNSAIVIVKLGIVAIFLYLGIMYLLHHPALGQANWHPFVPPAEPEMDSGPPGERDTRQRQDRRHVDPEIAKPPERLFSQKLRDPRREKDASGEDGNAVGPRIRGHHLFLRPAGPERCDDPTDEPGNPDDGKQLGGPGGRPAAPDEIQQFGDILAARCGPYSAITSNAIPAIGVKGPGMPIRQ